MKSKDENIQDRIEDALMGFPIQFTVGDKPFWLYPKTLGKVYLLNRLRRQLGINEEFAKSDPFAEALRVCREKKDIVLRAIVYMASPAKRDIYHESYVVNRMEFLDKNMTDEEIATVFLTILTDDDLLAFEKHFGFNLEYERKRKVADVKSSKNSVSFGAHTIWGTLIDFACQLYCWTLEYVVWGISYVSLMMLYTDKSESIYLSDEEKKKLGHGFSFDGEVINADDPRNMGKIKSMKWD